MGLVALYPSTLLSFSTSQKPGSGPLCPSLVDTHHIWSQVQSERPVHLWLKTGIGNRAIDVGNIRTVSGHLRRPHQEQEHPHNPFSSHMRGVWNTEYKTTSQ